MGERMGKIIVGHGEILLFVREKPQATLAHSRVYLIIRENDVGCGVRVGPEPART